MVVDAIYIRYTNTSHMYNIDPRVHQDYMFFTCLLTIFNIYFRTNAL